MTRYMCPDCDGGGMLLLNDNLKCTFCKGKYVWKKEYSNPAKQGKEAIKRLRSRM